MIKNKIMPTVVLVAICVAAALLLSVINYFTAPIIKEREENAKFDALLNVLPDGSDFKSLEITESYPTSVSSGYSANGGFVFEVKGMGRNGEIVVMVGIDADGKIVGTEVISESESAGYGDKVYAAVEGTSGAYNGMDATNFAPHIVAGATLTSNGFAQAIDAALKAYVVANGGEVDNRTPEEILQDSCNAALGTEGKTFERWFATEKIDGVNAVYETEGGRVFVIGDSFIGVKADGTVATEDVDAETAEKLIAANALISASALTELDLPEGTKKTVLKVSVTTGGSYVIDMVTQGSYSSKGGWAHGDGKDIYFTVSITADGEIIDVVTTADSESKGYGDTCATEEFYAGIRGATREAILDLNFSTIAPDDYADQIPAGSTGPAVIAGATFTTVYYQRALLDAFDIVASLAASN